MLTLEAPRDVPTNRLFRAWLLGRCSKSKRARQAVKERCGQDILFYVNSFVWTFDPRVEPSVIPFATYRYQDRAFQKIVSCIKESSQDRRSRDVVVEKSRDMGATWVCLTTCEWFWHFGRGKSFLMLSRKGDLVESHGSFKSIMGKFDFIHEHLPEWLVPKMDRLKNHIGNKDNECAIEGDTTTGAAGVGDRHTAIFLDEFSRMDNASEIAAGTADATRCRIFNFTPYGTGNAAYRLAMRSDVIKLRMHWTQHPEKNKGLYRSDPKTAKLHHFRYDEEKDGLDELKGPEVFHGEDYQFVKDGVLRSPAYDDEDRRKHNRREMSMMWDIDYQGSNFQFFDRSTIFRLQAAYACPPVWEGDVNFDRETGKFLGLTAQDGGPLKLWIKPQNGKVSLGRYAMGGDLSTGTGATPSCLSIVNATTGEKVAEYITPFTQPHGMAYRAVALAWCFKDDNGQPAIMAWEMQGPGIPFGNKVIELGFRRVYYRRNERAIHKPRVGKHFLPGWTPTNENKRSLLEEYRSALCGGEYLNRSTPALEECLAFVFTVRGTVEYQEGVEQSDTFDPVTGLDPSGARENHGDRVIADALSWMMAKSSYKAFVEKKSSEPPVLSMAWRRNYAKRLEREVARD